MRMRLATSTVTVRRPGVTTDMGVSVPDYSATADTTVQGCIVIPAAFPDSGQSPRTRSGIVAYLPAGTVVRVHDRIVFDSVEYRVDAAPTAWTSPSGSLDHIEVHGVRDDA